MGTSCSFTQYTPLHLPFGRSFFESHPASDNKTTSVIHLFQILPIVIFLLLRSHSKRIMLVLLVIFAVNRFNKAFPSFQSSRPEEALIWPLFPILTNSLPQSVAKCSDLSIDM